MESLFRAANGAITNGVVAATDADRKKYWRHWRQLLGEFEFNDPHLLHTSIPVRIALLAAFCERVRRGEYGKGRQVRVGTVQLALRAVGKTCEMEGLPNPTYREPNRYLLPLSRQLEAYRRHDPVSQPQLAVPVSVPQHMFLSS